MIDTERSPAVTSLKGRSPTEGEERKEAAAGEDGQFELHGGDNFLLLHLFRNIPSLHFDFDKTPTRGPSVARLSGRSCVGARALAPVRNNHGRVSKARGSRRGSSGKEGGRQSKGRDSSLAKLAESGGETVNFLMVTSTK